ncbi:DUF6350 family protein [Sinomonas sp. JGH33]|uniref:DUF6350 family protein n=1 Tax=Sinomonas terricola TaxID=3110330 RepID=A0ABU5T9F4_9MICC|nr:DUF6350 family protein [Sinomonas sp. JGH33]MEA5456332.1 DUF6350 family protein [Sinomonas sp. JGH33]
MKLRADQSGLRGLPMPLWLQGAVESFQAVLISAVGVLVPIAAVWLTGGFGSFPLDHAARLGGQAWLVVHGVPLRLNGAGVAADGGASPTSSVLAFVPLGFALIPFFLSWRAGRRLARASYADTLWQGLLGAAALYAAAGFATAFVCSTPEVSAGVGLGAAVPLVPVLLGLVVGARREAGSWARLIGVEAVDWISRTGQYSRWAGSYAWAIIRAGYVSAVGALGLSAALLTVDLAVRWADIATVYEALGAGGVGGAALTLAQLGYAPNLAVWTLGWSSGAGVSLGVGSSASALTTAVGPLPPIPALAAIPTSSVPVASAALVLPVIAGVFGGWWFQRAGEDHFDEWLAIKVPARWFTASVSALVVGALVGLVGGALCAGAAWLAGGSGGVGRFTQLGPNPLWTLVWVGAETAIGAVLGYALGPWLERGQLARAEGVAAKA